MADKTYRLDFALSNGAKKSVQFTAPQGPRGESGVYILADGETIFDVPADANVVIDPNGSADFNGGAGGGASSWEDLGSDYGEVAVLPECNPVYSEDDGAFFIIDVVPLVVGNEYMVNWNDVPYKAVAGEVEIEGMMLPYLGDMGVMMGNEPSTGHPFLIMCFPAELAAQMGVGGQAYPFDGSTELTLSITGMSEIVDPVPMKYLPDGYGYVIPAGQVILEETEYTVQETALPVQNVVPNCNYKVTMNGVEYTTKAMEITFSDMDAVVIGNARTINNAYEDTGEPFTIMLFSGMWVVYAADSNTGTVSIVTEESYAPFDKRYIDFAIVSGSGRHSIRSKNAVPESEDYKIGDDSIALGVGAKVPDTRAIAIGAGTVAIHDQVAVGNYNAEEENSYCFVVGCGSVSGRKTALKVMNTTGFVIIETPGALVLTSQSGKQFSISVNDDGKLITSEYQ